MSGVLNLETIYGTTEEVGLNLNPQTNIFFAAYHYWNLGKRYNRFYIEPGYSIPLSTVKYVQKTGDPITSESAHRIKLTSPGGIIISAGFSFVIF